MHRYLKLFCFILPFLSLSTQAAPTVWQATKGDLVFTLFGSIHVGKSEFYPLPGILDEELASSDGLVVEAMMSTDASLTIPTDKTTLQLLSKSELQTLEEVASEANIPVIALRSMQPWQAAMALQLAQSQLLNLSPEFGIDNHFEKRAIQQGKKIFELETMQQQIDLISSFEENGKGLLLDTINNWTYQTQTLDCLISAWQQGDTETLRAITEETSSSPEFEQRLLIDRNHDWIEKLTDRHAYPSGNYLVVVGGLHLYGEEGLLKLFQQEEFDVKALNEGQTVNCFEAAS